MARKQMLKKGDVVQFTANKWFDSRYGNTYHVVEVSVLPKGSDRWYSLGTSPIAYGYDRQYEETGREILTSVVSMPRGWGANPDQPLWRLRNYGVEFISVARKVKRKRDLFKGLTG